MTRVLVVIPAFDAERWLRDAAASVLAQSMGDLALVIVDDGSRDGTLAAARAIPDPRVTVLTCANGGPARARNLGWRHAPAEFVAFLDADDRWDADKLRVQTTHLDHHPRTVAVGCFMRYESSSGRAIGRAGQEVDDADQRRIAQGALFPFPTSSLVVRRDALDAVHGFDETFRAAGSEDLDLYARLAQQGRLECVPRILGSYRIHPASAMARDRRRINMEARFVRQRLEARAAGGDLAWDAFVAAYRPTWRERRRDLVEQWYRAAALWHGEGRPWRAARCLALAAAMSPGYTLPRIYRQRRGIA